MEQEREEDSFRVLADFWAAEFLIISSKIVLNIIFCKLFKCHRSIMIFGPGPCPVL